MPDIWMDVDTAVTVPCNLLPLIDATDFKTIEDGTITYDLVLVNWNFVTSAGVVTSTEVDPTEPGVGVHDWSHVDGGIYKIEIPDSGGTVNNDAEGYGWISGSATGCLPFRGPTIGFRDATINDKLCDSAWSATRGLAGTAVPDAAAGEATGLPISTAGMDLDDVLAGNTPQTGDSYALLGTPSEDTIAEDIALIQTTCTQIGTDVGVVDGIVDSILEDTGSTLQTAIGTIDGNVASILEDTGSTLPTAIAAVQTEVDKIDTLLTRQVVYEEGAIWVDSNVAVGGTVDWVDGTSKNPCKTTAQADTIADSLGFNKFMFASNGIAGIYTLNEAHTYREFRTVGGWISLNGQDVTGTQITGAVIVGTAVGAANFIDCAFADGVTLPDGAMRRSLIVGTINLTGATDYFIDNCINAGSAAFDFGDAVGDTTVYCYDWSGALTIKEMGSTGTDVLHLGGNGVVTFDDTCAGGTAYLYGNMTAVNNGSVTINQSVTIPPTAVQIREEMDDNSEDLDSLIATLAAFEEVNVTDGAVEAIATAAEKNAIADHVIRRTFENACDSSDGDTKAYRSLLGAIAKLVNKVAIADSTLTIYEDDDTTALGTQAITTSASADPITALDTD